MMKYDYRNALKHDICQYLAENFLPYELETMHSDSELYDRVFDLLFLADDVTGNGSGSYTFSAYRAEKNLAGNFDLLVEALEDFCADTALYARCLLEPETADVYIRCYLLPFMLAEVVEEWRVYFSAL